jgi:hypothetical protein
MKIQVAYQITVTDKITKNIKREREGGGGRERGEKEPTTKETKRAREKIEREREKNMKKEQTEKIEKKR